MDAKSMPALELFYCYARGDKPERDELDQHLAGLKRQYHITSWSDQEISPGTPWEKEIESHLNTAHIILLLVSARFMDSDYCYSVEMQKALKRNEEGTACVIPILLRPVYLGDAPFVEKLQMLPTDAKPVSKWADRDEALWDVTSGIAKAIVKLMQSWPSKEAWIDKGNRHYNLKKYKEALAAYEQALLLDPNFVHAWDGKGDAFLKLLKYEEAIAAFEHVLNLDPNFASAWNNKGIALYELKKYEEALTAYEHALNLDPNFASAWNNKGYAFLLLQKYEEAIAAFEHALSLDPNFAPAWHGKGYVLSNFFYRLEEAVAAYEQALLLDPNVVKVWQDKGDALSVLNSHEEALAAYEQALHLNPDNIDVLIGKGDALSILNRHEEALAAFEQALRLDPNNSEAHIGEFMTQLQINKSKTS